MTPAETIALLRTENRILRRQAALFKHAANRIPLCPDHRDKTEPEDPCLVCQVNGYLDRIVRLQDDADSAGACRWPRTDHLGATWHPWTDGWAVGFRVEPPPRTHTGSPMLVVEDQYVYLNPSSVADDGMPNVFLYHGPHGDPGKDPTVVYVDPFRKGII